MSKTQERNAPIEISEDEFQKIGHALIESIAQFINTIRDRPVTIGEHPQKIQAILGNESPACAGSGFE